MPRLVESFAKKGDKARVHFEKDGLVRGATLCLKTLFDGNRIFLFNRQQVVDALACRGWFTVGDVEAGTVLFEYRGEEVVPVVN